MSKIVLPHVILGYVLIARNKVTLSDLKKIKRKIEKIDSNIFVDLDESLIYKAEEEYPRKFRVDLENNDIVIYVKERFTILFLDTCYQYLFSNREKFNEIKKILLTP